MEKYLVSVSYKDGNLFGTYNLGISAKLYPSQTEIKDQILTMIPNATDIVVLAVCRQSDEENSRFWGKDTQTK